MSHNPDHEYFSDGISEDVITLLSRNRWLYVIARNSSFAYRETTKDVRHIGCELGARYVVEGSVRKLQNRVRVAVQLIDTHDGTHLWAERYDCELEDIFQVQDDIAQSIAATVEPELSVIEAQRARAKPPDSLNAWDCYQRGVHSLFRFSEPDLKEAKSQFEKSIQFDPNFAAAYARLAYVYVQRYWYGPHNERESNVDQAIRAARQAVDLDERDALGHLAMGRAYVLQRRCDVGIAELREAIELNPGLAQAYFALGQALHFAGKSEDSIPYLDTALRLSPHDSHAWTFLHIRAVALFKLGKLDEAEEAARASVRQTNATHWAFATLASILGAKGKARDAALIVEELLELKPNYSCQFAAQEFLHQKDAEFMARYLEGLRKVGLPD
jgi:TolB-like protein/Tfp pilus assembly protein PilF